MVQPQGSLGGAVEEIAGVQRAVAKIFEDAAVKLVAAGLADHADLPGGAGAILGRIVARIHAELGDRLKTVLQAETRRDFPVQIAGRGVDNRAGLDAVETHRIFLVRASAEANVVEAAAAGGLRARRQQIELRKLPAVERKRGDLTGIDVGADGSGAGVHLGEFAAGDGDFRSHRSRLQNDVHGAFLPDADRDPGGLPLCKAALLNRDFVRGRSAGRAPHRSRPHPRSLCAPGRFSRSRP